MIAQRFYVHIHLHLVIHGRIIIIGRGGLYHRVVKKNDKLWDFFQPKKVFWKLVNTVVILFFLNKIRIHVFLKTF